MFRRLTGVLRDQKGVATSLLEATATITVGAVLASAAIAVTTDKIQDARIVEALQDVQSMADAINTFEKDNLLFPIFESAGNASASAVTSDPNPSTNASSLARPALEVEVLMSAVGGFTSRSGDAAVDGVKPESVKNWLTGSPLGGSNDHVDTFEAQFMDNNPKYTVRGAISFDPRRGYAGPYLQSLPPTDPWGNRYQCNAHYLNNKDLTDPLTGLVQSFQTLVISGGPNEQIQTAFEAQADGSGKIKISGDDIAYRVR